VGVIQVSGLAFAHPGGTEVFRDVTFRAASGAHAALVGPNGVGKSTLLGCIAGELRPSEGSVHVDQAVTHMPQSIGTNLSGTGPVEARASTTVRELLVHLSRSEIRDASLTLERAERANDAEANSATGVALGEAVVAWDDLGGYEAESRWDAACEAVLGAVFADGGYEAAKRVVQACWRPQLGSIDLAIPDAKSVLQEWAQGRRLPLPRYSEIAREGPDHAPRFTAEVHIEGVAPERGQGANKREAEQAAALAMLLREGVWQAPQNG